MCNNSRSTRQQHEAAHSCSKLTMCRVLWDPKTPVCTTCVLAAVSALTVHPAPPCTSNSAPSLLLLANNELLLLMLPRHTLQVTNFLSTLHQVAGTTGVALLAVLILLSLAVNAAHLASTTWASHHTTGLLLLVAAPIVWAIATFITSNFRVSQSFDGVLHAVT